MTPTRLLLLSHGAVHGGSESQYTDLLQHLSGRPEYAVYGAFPDGPHAPLWRSLSVDTCAYRGRLPERPRLRGYVGCVGYVPLYWPGLIRFVRRHRIELLLVNSSVAAGAIALAGWLRIPTVVVVREFVSPEWLRSVLFRLIERVACRVIVVSDALRTDFVRRTGSAKVRRIYGGVDTDRFSAHPWRGAIQNVGVVGSLTPLKGQLDFVRAVAQLEPERRTEKMRFHLVGPIPRALATYHRRIRTEITRHGLTDQFVLTGELADMRPAYATLDVVVVASHSEGQSLTVLESWASGCAVIATRCGGPSEMIEDGVNGLLVPPADPAALAGALRRLIDDPALGQRLSMAGRRDVERRFNTLDSCRAMQSVLDGVTADARGAVVCRGVM